jgi:hypothetical protein
VIDQPARNKKELLEDRALEIASTVGRADA